MGHRDTHMKRRQQSRPSQVAFASIVGSLHLAGVRSKPSTRRSKKSCSYDTACSPPFTQRKIAMSLGWQL